LLPVALVLVSLLSLALLPVVSMRRTADLRTRISTVAEPSRALVTQIQNAIALESASARAFLLTGDRESIADHARASESLDRALQRLVPLARELGPDVSAHMSALVSRLRPADALLDSLFDGRIAREQYVKSLEEQQRRLQTVLTTAADLDGAIGRAAAASLADLQATERFTAVVTVVLVLLALVAAMLVANLGRHYRRLAVGLGRWSRQQEALIRIGHQLNHATRPQDVVDAVAHDTASASVLDAELRFQGPEEPAFTNTEKRLVVPLTSDGHSLGRLVFHRGRDAAEFGQTEIAHVATLRELAAAAVHRVTLLEALGASEERFRQIAEAIHDFIWLSDADFQTHLFVNSAYERIWGRRPDALYANPLALLEGVHEEDRERVRAALENLPRGRYDIEFRVVRPDGEQRWVWSRAFPVLNERGEIYRIAGITEDITDRKRAAESRSRLIRGFTHDVKNPLGAADGFLALLHDEVLGGLSTQQKESIGRVRRSIHSALNLIGNLLDIARAEAGQLEIERASMKVDEVVREVADEFRAEAQAKKLTLTVDVAAGSDDALLVESDQARVRQILSNLLSNAVKYTRSGGEITVRAEPRSDGELPAKGEWVAVAVCDTGTGIAADKQAMLFREFTRFDPGAAEGSGIGLAISQRIARALDAAITVNSEPGVGSTFTLWLPRRKPKRTPAPAVPAGRATRTPVASSKN
jgi:PAS domain S-box-containing protein